MTKCHIFREVEPPFALANLGVRIPNKKTPTQGVFKMRLEGFEPPTFWFVAKRSIQLGYKRKNCLKYLQHVNYTNNIKNYQVIFSFLVFPFKIWITLSLSLLVKRFFLTILNKKGNFLRYVNFIYIRG